MFGSVAVGNQWFTSFLKFFHLIRQKNWETNLVTLAYRSYKKKLKWKERCSGFPAFHCDYSDYSKWFTASVIVP